MDIFGVQIEPSPSSQDYMKRSHPRSFALVSPDLRPQSLNCLMSTLVAQLGEREKLQRDTAAGTVSRLATFSIKFAKGKMQF